MLALSSFRNHILLLHVGVMYELPRLEATYLIFETKVSGSEREVGKEPDCKLGERCLFSLYLFSLVNKSNFVGLAGLRGKSALTR